ncbi:MAG: hypothetical protein R3A46_12590 [Thermomicrobiales bacterium]
MPYPATPAALVRAIEMKIEEDRPPTQIVREIQAIVDHYKTTLVPGETIVLKVLEGVFATHQEQRVTTIDGRNLELEDLSLDSYRITLILRDTTLGASYETTIPLDHIETEPI